ncbi:hypothetical protein [Streptomyces hirsutus]|uniref:hypothetical protein n=1 Tax=Streptomyces hirsutus TaxID=35620 RepID=UPI003326D2E0
MVDRWSQYDLCCWCVSSSQVIRRGAHKNVQALEADIRAWVKDWNEDPEPFIRTKTAAEILDSLAHFCRRISGAGRRAGGKDDAVPPRKQDPVGIQAAPQRVGEALP